MLFYKIICICYLIHFNYGFDIPIRIKNKYDSLKKKILHLWKGRKGKYLHLDINEIEYPRGNETLRNIHKKLWNEYYKCLKEQYSSIGALKTLYPVALAALEGTSVTMRCSICLSPNDIHFIESVNWFYRNTRNIYAENVEIDLAENVVISANDRALTLYNVQTFQEGLYWCKMADTLSAPYYLYVADETEPTIFVRPNIAPNSSHPEPPTIVPKYELEIFSAWTFWSSCSVCDRVGIRIRYGHCTFSSMNFPSSEQKKNEIIFTTDSTIRQRKSVLNADENALKKKIENVLIVFQNKIPCRSWFTPKKVQEIPEIKNRKTEIMKQFCKVKCQREVIFEIRDKVGKVLESANNSAGIYSTVQGMPETRPSVQRITIYRKYGERTKLKCPGNLNFDLPIIWKIGVKEVNPETIKAQSHKRVYIDSRQRIVFKKIRYADINIYSCWQRSALVGTIRLEVSYDVSTKLNHRVMIFTGVPIISVILFVFWRAWRGRHNYVKR